MTQQEEYILELVRNGMSATFAYKTGTQCPCMIYRDANNPKYDQEYHDIFTTAEDCNGTGLISVTTTTKTIKGIFYDPEIQSTGFSVSDFYKNTPVGEWKDYALIGMGFIETTGNTFFNMKSYSGEYNILTYNSETFRIKRIYDLHNFGLMVGFERLS